MPLSGGRRARRYFSIARFLNDSPMTLSTFLRISKVSTQMYSNPVKPCSRATRLRTTCQSFRRLSGGLSGEEVNVA